MAVGFPWYKSIDDYIVKELEARIDPIKVSRLVPWISATSNLGSQFTLSSGKYDSIFGGGNPSYDTTSEMKYRPNPIITDFSIDFANRGTLRMATLKIKCFTPEQLTEMQKYFMEPGISIMVQWGWNYSISKGKSVGPVAANAGNVNKYNRNPDALFDIRSSNGGCYDNLVGIITGGESGISGEEFNISCKITTMGEILMNHSQEGVQVDTVAEKPSPFVVPGKLITQQEEAKDPVVNMSYFFNQLPAEFRTVPVLAAVAKGNPKGDFVNFNESALDEAKFETTKGMFNNAFSGDMVWQGKQMTATDSESPITSKKYLSFYMFIEILNQMRVKFETGEGAPADFTMDIGTRDAPKIFISSFSGIFSTDERVFIPNKKSYNFLNDEPYYVASAPTGKGAATIDTSVGGISFPREGGQTYTKGNESVTIAAGTCGWIGDVFIDMEVAIQAWRDVTRPIKDVLDGVLSVMSEAVDGMWGFQIIENGGTLVIADGNLRNPSGGSSIVEFNMIGTKSFFLDCNFNLTISKEMSSKVYMEKATDGKVSNPNELTGLFSNQKDNILKKLNVETQTAKPDQTIEADDTKDNAWKDLRRNVKIIMNPEFIDKDQIEENNVDAWGRAGMYLNKKVFTDVRKTGTNMNGVKGTGEAYTGRPLDVEFSFTVLGMSGFKVGHLYRVIGLPPQYNKRGAFQVEEITHKVDTKQWITEVSGRFRPFYKG
jgi:hypothetical protein